MKRFLLFPLFLTLLACSEESESHSEASSEQTNPVVQDTAAVDAPITFEPLQMTFSFGSLDGLEITADVSEISEDGPYLLLCHQARYSRGEYIETAKWFNELGFNTLAIDQRSGDAVNDIINETAKRATEDGLPTDYIDAEQDIRAAIGHISTLLADSNRPIYILGSSYSSALVLKIAADTTFDFHDQIAGVLSFSPGEYYSEKIAPTLAFVDCPIFITCPQNEFEQAGEIASGVPEDLLTFYKPETPSIHGSRALWASQTDYLAVRAAVQEFLTK